MRPQVDRSTIETLDRGGRVIHRVEVAVRPGAAPDAEEFGRYLNQGVFDALNDNLTRAGQGDPVSYLWDCGADRVLFSPTPPPGSMSPGTFLMARPDESIFMDAWHLLVALGLGWLAGGCLLAGRQARRIYRHLKGEPRPPLTRPAES